VLKVARAFLVDRMFLIPKDWDIHINRKAIYVYKEAQRQRRIFIFHGRAIRKVLLSQARKSKDNVVEIEQPCAAVVSALLHSGRAHVPFPFPPSSLDIIET
jgi:hypothetical protein